MEYPSSNLDIILLILRNFGVCAPILYYDKYPQNDTNRKTIHEKCLELLYKFSSHQKSSSGSRFPSHRTHVSPPARVFWDEKLITWLPCWIHRRFLTIHPSWTITFSWVRFIPGNNINNNIMIGIKINWYADGKIRKKTST